MKVRNGFVSNSSSSSFMICIAKIVDIDMLRQYLEEHNISQYDLKVNTVFDLGTNYNAEVKNGMATIESFTYDEVSINISDLDKLDLVLTCYATGGDDSDFWDGDDYNYDIDLDFFSDNENAIFNMFADPKSGLDISSPQRTFGAGRNG